MAAEDPGSNVYGTVIDPLYMLLDCDMTLVEASENMLWDPMITVISLLTPPHNPIKVCTDQSQCALGSSKRLVCV